VPWKILKIVKAENDRQEFFQQIQPDGSMADAEFPNEAGADAFISTLRGGRDPNEYFEPLEIQN